LVSQSGFPAEKTNPRDPRRLEIETYLERRALPAVADLDCPPAEIFPVS
jgi:hypothetical protein